MDTLTSPSRRDGGFTLVEALIAMGILSVGLLGLAQAFYVGMQHMSTSASNLIAREKAREAVESVLTARDTRTITWGEVRNVAGGGVFLDGPQSLNNAGVDGLVNTADDADAGVETQRDPGPNGVFCDTESGCPDDDISTPLNGFQREIQINDLANADIRELVVTISFTVGSQRRSYMLRTFVSAFS